MAGFWTGAPPLPPSTVTEPPTAGAPPTIPEPPVPTTALPAAFPVPPLVVAWPPPFIPLRLELGWEQAPAVRADNVAKETAKGMTEYARLVRARSGFLCMDGLWMRAATFAAAGAPWDRCQSRSAIGSSAGRLAIAFLFRWPPGQSAFLGELYLPLQPGRRNAVPAKLCEARTSSWRSRGHSRVEPESD